MADPAVAALAEASGDPAAFHLVYSTLMRRYDSSIRLGHMTQFADEVAAIAVQVLRDAGRLQPADGTLSEQWTMRINSAIDSAQPGLPYVTREEAEARLRQLLAYREGKWPATGELLRREVRGWPDGSCWVGPWQPVPTEGADR